MSKDKENVPFPILNDDGPIDPAPEAFAPDEMVRCDECLRANPPTRVNCLYCAAVLPLDENTINLQKPALRPLEKWEQGYNNILLPRAATQTVEISDVDLREIADLLRLRLEDIEQILSSQTPLPLARAATLDEASLVQRRLGSLGIESCIVSDGEPGTDAMLPNKVRALEFDEDAVYAFQTPEAPAIRLLWPELLLLVVGRLIVKRVELSEQKGGRGENRILNSSEFVTDERVVDFFTRDQAVPYRIKANSFDFSCLGENKSLVASENISTLLDLMRARAPQVDYDDAYDSLRKSLDAVWPVEQQNESSGWRRERPGKYSIGSATQQSNEMQFLRYSRLRYYFKVEKRATTNDDA